MNDRPEILNQIAQTIYDKKGFNIMALDVRGISTMTDYYIIAEGTVDRHVKALSDAIIEAMEEHGEKPVAVAGVNVCDWIILDFGDILVHLFQPEFRERYAIEAVWHEGRVIDVQIDCKESAEVRGSS